MSVHNVQTISCFCAVLHLVPFYTFIIYQQRQYSVGRNYCIANLTAQPLALAREEESNMTVNKSQSQSPHRVGIFCSRDFFSHGQFHVAASRVGRSSKLRILAQDEQTNKNHRFLSNVVYE